MKTFEEWFKESQYEAVLASNVALWMKHAYEAGRADKAVVWPSAIEINRKADELYRTSKQEEDIFEACVEMAVWLKSKVKPFEMPVVSDEEICESWKSWINSSDKDVFGLLESYIEGFKAAMALVRERMGE